MSNYSSTVVLVFFYKFLKIILIDFQFLYLLIFSNFRICRCHWLVDSSGLADPDVQIIVYLTQLYVTSGLSFTEYAFYDPTDSSLQRNPSLLLSVSEQNSVTTRWLATRSRFLVVELQLERLEGNHLRVLDHLLDVFGFNITYEMTAAPVRTDSCSVIDCSFAGNCFVGPDYRWLIWLYIQIVLLEIYLLSYVFVNLKNNNPSYMWKYF